MAKKGFNPLAKLIIVLVLAFGFLYAVLRPSSNKQSETPASPTATPILAAQSPTPTPAPLTFEDKVKKAVNSKVTKATVEIDQAVDAKTFEDIPGKKDVLIDYEMDDEFWDTNAAKTTSYKNAADLMQAVFPIDPIISSLVITAKVPTKDAYGNSKVSVLTVVTVTRSTYAKINFADFDYHNIPTIADIYSEGNVK